MVRNQFLCCQTIQIKVFNPQSGICWVAVFNTRDHLTRLLRCYFNCVPQICTASTSPTFLRLWHVCILGSDDWCTLFRKLNRHQFPPVKQLRGRNAVLVIFGVMAFQSTTFIIYLELIITIEPSSIVNRDIFHDIRQSCCFPILHHCLDIMMRWLLFTSNIFTRIINFSRTMKLSRWLEIKQSYMINSILSIWFLWSICHHCLLLFVIVETYIRIHDALNRLREIIDCPVDSGGCRSSWRLCFCYKRCFWCIVSVDNILCE